MHPHSRPVRSYREARLSEAEASTMASLQHRLLERGVYGSSYGMGCLSLAMGEDDVDHLVAAVAGSLPLLAP
jgi:glutamate-1-semialdehyde aminotransferase